MMIRLIAGALVIGTIFVLSPERRRTAVPTPPAGTLAAIPDAARGAIAERVGRSLLTDAIDRMRQALPGAEATLPGAQARSEDRHAVVRGASLKP